MLCHRGPPPLLQKTNVANMLRQWNECTIVRHCSPCLIISSLSYRDELRSPCGQDHVFQAEITSSRAITIYHNVSRATQKTHQVGVYSYFRTIAPEFKRVSSTLHTSPSWKGGSRRSQDVRGCKEGGGVLRSSPSLVPVDPPSLYV